MLKLNDILDESEYSVWKIPDYELYNRIKLLAKLLRIAIPYVESENASEMKHINDIINGINGEENNQ